MGYLYAAMWLAIGLILIFSIAKEHKIFYLAGGFFVLLGGWWAADTYFEEDLFSGPWRSALNIVTLVALVVISVVFFIERQKNIKAEAEQMKAAKEKADNAAKAAGEAPVPDVSVPAGEDSLRASVAGVNIMRPRPGSEDKPADSEED